jgi:hypothetical protein
MAFDDDARLEIAPDGVRNGLAGERWKDAVDGGERLNESFLHCSELQDIRTEGMISRIPRR